MLNSVAVLYHPRRAQAISEAEWLASTLKESGVTTALGSGWDPEVVEHLCCDRELVVVFGGDGTIIHVARLASQYGVPIIGINLGRVGFLADVTPEALRGQVGALREKRYWIEERIMLDVHCKIDGNMHHFLSLNEVAVARGVVPRAVHVNIALNGEGFVTYTADGILVATATGSTAYSLAAGGPILYPASRDLLITPVAPHLHIGRSVIVPGEMEVSLTLASSRPAVVSVDGTDEHELRPHDRVDICRSDRVAHFAHLRPQKYFYSALADRLK